MAGRWSTILLAAGLGGCGGGDVLVVDGTGWFDPPMLDFGAQPVGVQAALDARMTNREGRDLIVSDVRFDPATEAYAARLKAGDTLRGAFLPSGGSAAVRVLYEPSEAIAYDTRMLVVFDRVAVPIELKGSGRPLVQPHVALSPTTIGFPPTELHRDVTQALTVENQGDEPIQIVSVLFAGQSAQPGQTPVYLTEAGSAQPLAARALAARERAALAVHFDPLLIASVDALLTLELDSGDTAVLHVTGSGIAAGTLSCAPPALMLGPVVRGSRTTQSVRCTAAGGLYTLADIGLRPGSSAGLSLDHAPAAGSGFGDGQSFQFDVNFAAAGPEGPQSGTVELAQAGAADVIQIPIGAQVAAPALADLDIVANLSWNAQAADLDLHLIRDGHALFDPLNDCNFKKKQLDWGNAGDATDDPFLDQDATPSDTGVFGPERIDLGIARETTYDVYVHYANFSNAAAVPAAAVLQVYFRGTMAARVTRTMSACGDLWHVGKVDRSSGIPRFTVLDTIAGGASCQH